MSDATELPDVPGVGAIFAVRVHDEELTYWQLRANLQEGRTVSADVYNPANAQARYARDRCWTLKPIAGSHVPRGYAIVAIWGNALYDGRFGVRVVFNDEAESVSVEFVRAEVY